MHWSVNLYMGISDFGLVTKEITSQYVVCDFVTYPSCGLKFLFSSSLNFLLSFFFFKVMSVSITEEAHPILELIEFAPFVS